MLLFQVESMKIQKATQVSVILKSGISHVENEWGEMAYRMAQAACIFLKFNLLADGGIAICSNSFGEINKNVISVASAACNYKNKWQSN